MEFQTNVYVNGEWHTQTVDAQRALVTEPGEAADAAVDMEPRRVPPMGLLSRTVVRSPLIRWILPARIRRADKNDVILVGEDFIHIKEVQHGGKLLRHVATKADFGSRIRSAAVMGVRRNPVIAALVKQEPNDDVEMGDASADTEAASPKTAAPSQTLVLCLASHEVVFLCARDRPDGGVSFCMAREPLSRPASAESPLESQGQFLAVDPFSRAIAVAAYSENIAIMSTKSTERQRLHLARGGGGKGGSPVTGSTLLNVSGAIVAVEFLSPAVTDTNHVVLLVLHCSNGRLRASCFDWDNSHGLETAQRRVNGIVLEEPGRMPELLIPLRLSSGFLVVSGDSLVLWSDILTGSPRQHLTNIQNMEHRNRTDDSTLSLLWTQWARPHRNWEILDKSHEDFYIVREDGVLAYVHVRVRNEVHISRAGSFSCTVDEAFTSLDNLVGPDVLAACSNTGTGEVVAIGKWPRQGPIEPETRIMAMSPRTEATMPNWAPTLDGVVTKPIDSQGSASSSRDRSVCVTSGRGPLGAISELRLGCEVDLKLYLDEDSGVAGTNRVFHFPDAATREHRFLVSMPTKTVPLCFDPAFSGGDLIADDDWEVDLERETLAAGVLSGGWGFQVTRDSITTFSLDSKGGVLRRAFRVESGGDARFVDAAVSLDGSFIAAAQRDRVLTQLCVYIPDSETGGLTAVSTAFPLRDEPTCLSAFVRSGVPHVCVGCGDGSLLLLEFDTRRDRVASAELAAAPRGEINGLEAHATFESAVVVAGNSPTRDWLLLAGTRDGCIRAFGASPDGRGAPDGEGRLEWPEIALARTRLGHTPVRVTADPDDPRRAFALCGAEFCWLSAASDDVNPLHIHSVYLCDRDRPGYQQPPVLSLCKFHFGDEPGTERPAVALVHPAGVNIGFLDDEVKCVPRRLELQSWPSGDGALQRGTPTRIFQLEQLDLTAILVQCNHAGGDNQPAVSAPVPAPPTPSVLVVRNKAVVVEEGAAEGAVRDLHGSFALEPGERVYSVTEWVLESAADSNRYGLVVVGAGRGPESGRVLILKCVMDGAGVSLRQIKEKLAAGPVYAVAMYDAHTLLYSFQKRLRAEKYDEASKRWVKICEINLPSEGTQISTQDKNIYVTTLRHSVLIFKFDGFPDGSFRILDEIHSDGQARDTLAHLAVPFPRVPSPHRDHNLLLATDKQGTVAGLLQPPTRGQQSSLPTLFSTRLPRCLARLRRGDVRPPWVQGAHPRARVPVDDVLGFAPDGTVIALLVLDARAAVFLRMLENLLRAVAALREHGAPGSHRREGRRGGADYDDDGDDDDDDEVLEDAFPAKLDLDDAATTAPSSASSTHSLPPLSVRDVDPTAPPPPRTSYHNLLRHRGLPPPRSSAPAPATATATGTSSSGGGVGAAHPSEMHADGDFLLSALEEGTQTAARELAALLADPALADPEVWRVLRGRAGAALCRADDDDDDDDSGDEDHSEEDDGDREAGGEAWDGAYMPGSDLGPESVGADGSEKAALAAALGSVLAWTRRLYLGAYL